MRRSEAIAAILLATAGCSMKKEAIHPDQARWDKRYSAEEHVLGEEPAAFLRKNIALLPKGRALDIAAGKGRNAVYLARMGFDVDAVDISPVGLGKAEYLAAERGVRINAVVANLETWEPGESRYELVVNFLYLQRDLTPRIKRALKPGGIVVYETYTVEQMNRPGRHSLPRKFLLEAGELKRMFSDFEILHYSEATSESGDAVASLIARKPAR